MYGSKKSRCDRLEAVGPGNRYRRVESLLLRSRGKQLKRFSTVRFPTLPRLMDYWSRHVDIACLKIPFLFAYSRVFLIFLLFTRLCTNFLPSSLPSFLFFSSFVQGKTAWTTIYRQVCALWWRGEGGAEAVAERRWRQVDGMQTLTRVSRGGCAFSELSPPTSPSCQPTDSFHSANT